MRVVILVPRREDHGPRDKAWAWCKARWERLFPDWPIFEGHHNEGPFNRSKAMNEAAAQAGEWDVALLIDADIFIRRSQVIAAVESAAGTGKVTWAHRRWRGIRDDATDRIIADGTDFGPEVDGEDMDLIVERTNPISWSCCIAFPRKVWDDLGGMDERFIGWGFEDMALQCAVVGLYGHERIDGDVYHLNHPRVFGSGRAMKHDGEYTREAITNARLGRRYMVALRRDHGLHDRPGLPASPEEQERDILNLVRDDEKLSKQAQRLGMPNWSTWWPTLEELRDGARLARRGPRTVTVVVTSGGSEETWPERSEYLRRSLASLSEMVTGEIVQRVVYSDWAGHRDELAAIASEFGFYVAGDGHHGYPAMRQRLFTYLAKRAQGEYIFAAEDDFTYDRQVALEPMVQTLKDNPHLRQLALLRAPAYAREFEAGGVLESLPTPVELVNHRPHPFVQHRDHFTANPSLFHRSLVETPWPQGESSERRFGDRLLADQRAAFAYWGSGEPWITHLGTVKAAPVGTY